MNIGRRAQGLVWMGVRKRGERIGRTKKLQQLDEWPEDSVKIENCRRILLFLTTTHIFISLAARLAPVLISEESVSVFTNVNHEGVAVSLCLYICICEKVI